MIIIELSSLVLYIAVTIVVCQKQAKNPPAENKLDSLILAAGLRI